ncbi:MAG: trigger factor [Desulfovibrionales bacterium]
MEYQIEDLSPVKKKVTVTIPSEEANAAIIATVALYKRTADIKGFRKGKVPSSLVESRFKKDIYSEATTDLLNTQINQILNEKGLSPIGRLDVDAEQLERDKDYEYSFAFEVKPEIELPEYKGLEAEQEKVEVSEAEVNQVLEKLRNNLAQYTPITDVRAPKDGELGVISFQAFQDGEPVPGLKADNFDLPLGEGQALPEFEEVVKKLKTDETAEEEVTFPEDFLNKDLAGKTVTMKVTLHSIKEKKLPEVDDEFAKKAGGFQSVDQLKEAVEKSYMDSRSQIVKSAAQKKLLEQITSQVDFPLPEALGEGQVDALVEDRKERLERRGKSLESTGKTEEELKKELRPDAEDIVKSQLVLLEIAEEEGQEVSSKEIDMYLQQMSMRTGQDYNTLRDFHERNNLMHAIKDKLLADKAMDILYENAVIKEVEPSTDEQAGDKGEAEEKSE